MDVKFWHDKWEGEMYKTFVELYAIIKTSEKLGKKAYVRDIIFSSSEYETECQKLICHVLSIKCSAFTYKINRLGTYGVPAIAASATSSAAIVAECVLNFVTAIIDSLKLNMAAVDQVHPLLPDLAASLDKLGILPPDFKWKMKMKEWVSRLSNMEAAP
ncbi:hypothetical protein Goarm_008911 [Gossypium armourianum]|uniref:VPS28 C-terminal domain-containing protein n=1 Tax=Gossypium armourianum TaxID=34283 RepID=A0A7J9JRE9_9ROSI|nr:hypothetical protein [Gossypium armourianum]